ncbi:MAG TPA: efflux RND transporter permease subunit [Kiritimatiellia bacterium]|jgi:multidrug efflux pump subunit AcrB|nr:efflux RND transporter permease subunit [Kiritimatiellia bacterium]HOE36207.1 efflux RND transporter permease subunit [Kiritimatiellia bacterium]HOR73644.1 efflux RND transporter permease subunit [Kiritimatiellia bacterium]HOU58608.1 efflux RND transporter permease subunit [Kiritimatiellia bacterium]HPK68574.1 efflux RND transporter permease subunit [Kiritimatiellia bacterium]
MEERKHSITSGILQAFLKGNLSILLILISLAAGAAALLITPREEEPQIVVPLADVMVMMPGSSAEEVEQLVSSRLEKLLYQIDGVEYVYSMSRPGMAVVTVRFFVGENREDSLIKVYNKIFQNIDQTTPGIAGWVVKPIEIDDVPIVNVTLHGAGADTHQLYRLAEEVAQKLQTIPDSARISIHGGQKRVVHVYLDTERLAAYGLSAMEVAGALKISNAQMTSGTFEQADRAIVVEAGPFIENVDEVRNLMVGVHQNRPVYLRDVADIQDGSDELNSYTRLGAGPAAAHVANGMAPGQSEPAVTVAVAKKKGSNAVNVAREVSRMISDLRGSILPDGVQATVTRDYGHTANEKVNDLVMNLAMGILTVVGLIALSMSWREGIIVGLAIPITYSLTLLFNYLLGYTINRVTLFALILALGLLVDNPIVGVENISRFLSMKKYPRLRAVSLAMEEVMPPILLATLSIIVSFIPMFFITGMMGPYMAPMALNVPLTMLSSLLVALAITPWISSKLLKEAPPEVAAYDVTATGTYRVYHRLMAPFVSSSGRSSLLLLIVAGLFGFSIFLAASGRVPLKMLPFDNKDEMQIVVDMPAGTTLEATDAAVREIERYLETVPEVVNFVSTVGEGSPMDFNGLVRHYYLRQGPNMADVRINLLPRQQREMSSHAIALRIRNDIEAIGRQTGANLKIVEVPPGPPVLSTVVAEIYGRPDQPYSALIAAAEDLQTRMAAEQGVVDIDDSAEAAQQKLFFRVDREKAGLNGVSTEDVVNTLRIALSGMPAGTVHAPREQNELPIVLRLPREKRSDPERLKTIMVKGRMGNSVQLGELGTFEENVVEPTIMHKNMERVVYVTAEMAGRGPAYAVLNLQADLKKNPLPEGTHAVWTGEGEWKITVDVFRDLGIAFSAALLAIYVLLVYETGSYLLPIVIMLSIPLTLIGIMPGFWLLNAVGGATVGGYADSVFFTATAMIGMIALGGIVQRNAIILIDFIRSEVARGKSLQDAIIEAGAVRFRPIFLTAGTTLLGAWPITFDPIFSGLAWSIIFGLFVSTAFTLVVVPVAYGLIYRKPQPTEA